MALNAPFVEERLTALEKVRPWTPRLVAKLEALLAAEDPWELYRVDPIRFAEARGLDEGECIDLFLHATHLGLFRLEWRLLCPSCSDTVSSFRSLGALHQRCFCTLCHLDTEAQLDDYIRVSFNAVPEVRDLPFHKPESLSAEDFVFRYRLDRYATLPGSETREVEAMRSILRAGSVLEPGAAAEAVVEAADGVLAGHDFESGQSFLLPLDPAGADHADLSLGEKGWDGAVALRPGSLRLRLRNASGRRAVWGVVRLPSDHQNATLDLGPGLSGNRLLSSQTFRNLFRSETVGSSEGIGVRDLALLFTDLKGSTALYERIGDLKAFALVQQHFEHLSKVIQAHRGAVVKTIGDAVMASFSSPADAASAAVGMLKEIEDFNRSQGHREILLKVGVHRGPSIAVTLNDRLDYFGQTVNVAARVQGLADAEQVCVTEAAYRARGVAEALAGLPSRWEQAQLKGVRGAVSVLRVGAAGRPAKAAPKAKSAAKPKAKAKAKRKAKPKARAQAPRKPKAKARPGARKAARRRG